MNDTGKDKPGVLGDDPLDWMKDDEVDEAAAGEPPIGTEDDQVEAVAEGATEPEAGNSEAGRSAGEEVVLELSDDMTVTKAGVVYERLAEYLAMQEDIVINAGRVALIDTAGLQLLLAFTSQIERENRVFRWEQPSSELLDIAGRLDLSGQLKLGV